MFWLLSGDNVSSLYCNMTRVDTYNQHLLADGVYCILEVEPAKLLSVINI